MKKITFYGKDFSRLEEAEYSLDGSEKAPLTLAGSENECLEFNILNAFCSSYDKVPLLFPKNTALFNKYVGVFRIKSLTFREETYDATLEIRCRFDTDKKAFFLAAMLLCLTNKELNRFWLRPEVTISFHQVMDILLLFMFKNQLAEAAKKGIFRKYQRFENNDGRPHGTIDIARHIRENMGLNNGRVAYHYRELTANNPVNRLIWAAYKRLGEKYPQLCETHINGNEGVHSTLNILQTELGYSRTSVRNIVNENLRPITHPYFSEYEALRKTCLKILRDESVSIFDAEGSEETESLCVNVTWLWERFLEHHLERLLPPGLSLTTQGVNNRGKPIFYKLVGQEYKPVNSYSKPDFVLWPGEGRDRPIAILDAKFKRRWNNFFQEEDSSFTDEDSSKCFRDMVVFRSPRTGVIFPFREEGGEEGPYLKEYHIGIPISGDAGLRFDMVRVPVPPVWVPVPPEAETSFQEWHQLLESSVEQVLKDYLQKITGA
ncbi:hypothetical protein D1641_08060 [Colidextribacter sp. OB.20]|uniref:5-methylcytosine restriction system specificity protein McrC n=1 Tax=Colidextribacter sp. OB.20 TaxID=2304568 RepID=UPI0013708AAA|nr:hypothetical protein [Colidextribacter sp. OB.20]NBI09972.1 hypothetical protein [Colidextribacter sp. OB.20]